MRVVRGASLLSLGVAAVALAAAAAAERTPDGYRYTAAEVAQGRALYAERCVACHGSDMKGGEEAPPLVGARFDRDWRNRPPTELFARIKQTMPQDDPGTLTAVQAADAVAAILNANGVRSAS